MGKKKGKGKKSSDKSAKGKDGGGGEDTAGGAGGAREEEKDTPKEVLLKNELDELTEKVEIVKEQVDKLRKENEFLQNEANRTRDENHEYMSYMSKRANKRQETIISLNDWNQKQLNDLQTQKQVLLDKYEAEKNKLREIIIEKEKELSQTKQDINELGEYKELQETQQAKIGELSREVIGMRGIHTIKIQEIRANFLKEKHDFKEESEKRVAEMKRQANQEAVRSLQNHTSEMKKENKELRREVLEMIQQNQALQQHRKELMEQRTLLLQQEDYNKDIQQMKRRQLTGNVAY